MFLGAERYMYVVMIRKVEGMCVFTGERTRQSG